ncbi:MAG TPA: hypothetical protein VM432_04865, partial [Bdellovibrionales bacterium]|nr:hypothetical protein [Bdellovibrionales bacterium]
MRISTFFPAVLVAAISASAFAQDVPIAEWSGRLVLPAATQRLDDGAVLFRVENAPQNMQHLKGKTVWLRPDPSEPGSYRRFKDSSIDVVFNQKSKLKEVGSAEEEKVVMPSAINGWKKVSPLESLAAGSIGNSVQVEIQSPRLRENGNSTELFISAEPIILDGSRQALVKFVRKIDHDVYVVRHYNVATKQFDGREETVKIDFQKSLEGSLREVKNLDGIETHELNNDGWNVYGERTSDGFIVRSLESYRLFRANQASDFNQVFVGQPTSALRSQYWNISDADKTKIKKFAHLKSADALAKIGDEFL